MIVDAAYRPRHPEENPLYAAVAGHLETFLALQREQEHRIPAFIEREFRDLLDCGILAHGSVIPD
jgi:hypothetical protein